MERKTEVPGMYKVREGVVINKDAEALENYKKRKAKNKKLDQLEEDVNTIKADMQEIKELLKGLAK